MSIAHLISSSRLEDTLRKMLLTGQSTPKLAKLLHQRMVISRLPRDLVEIGCAQAETSSMTESTGSRQIHSFGLVMMVVGMKISTRDWEDDTWA